MKEVSRHIYVSDLISSVGKNYKQILKSLLTEGVITRYSDVIEVFMEKDKAVHFQSTLAFNSVKEVPIGPIKYYKKEE